MDSNAPTERWHLWYDNYDERTAFITEGSYVDKTEPTVIAEGIPYDDALKMVNDHNAGLPAPVWHYQPEKGK